MKKKYRIILYTSIFLLCVVASIILVVKKSNSVYEEESKPKVVKHKSMLSMNLEQTAGAGDYKTVTQSGWPTEGYKFNAELSRCEKGSELSWDDTKKAVIVSGNLSDKCYVYFDIYQPTLAEYIKSQYTGTQGDNALYYHNSTLTNGAGDNSYRYAGGDYVLTEAGKATGATMMIGYNNSVTTALIDFYCNGTKQYVGYASSCSTSHYYLIKGDTTQYQTYNEALNASVEKGYLTKDNVKNFVCFGSDATTCPTENLYRIIGVFNNHVKLIKYDYAKSSLLGTDGDFSQEYTSNYFSGEQGESPSSNSLYYWNNAGTNTWSASKLNTVNLNTNFTTNIGTAWANKIATTTWKVGGGTYANLRDAVPKTAYQYEVGSSASTTTVDKKIGLMYVSDYYYSASPSAWTLVGYNESDATKDYRAAKTINWLYLGSEEWTISRYSGYAFYAFRVYSGYAVYIDVIYSHAARPSFNLESSVKYVSGSGSMSDPVRIN